MQRNNNHIIIIGIMIILLVLTYNMALASDGSQESTGTIMGWLTDSNNSSAVQAIGSIAQVIAAILTLGVMLYLGYKQNKISKKQIEISKALSLYEKKYKVYMELIKLLNKVALEIKMPTSAINATEYIKDVGQAVIDFEFNTNEGVFLLDKDLLEYINQLENEITQFSQLVYDKAGKLEERMFLDMDQDIKKKRVYFENQEAEVRKKFESVLDFRNI